MAADRKAWVKIGARADGSLKRTLQGVTDATRKTSDETKRLTRQRVDEAKRAEREIQQEAKRSAQEAIRLEKEKERAAQRLAREQVAAARRSAQERIREEKRAADAQLRDARRVARERRQMLVGGALMGGYAAAKGLVQQAQGVTKVGTTESRLERAMEFKRSLISKGLEAGLTKEELPGAEKEILRAAKASGVDPLEMVKALEAAQERFDKFKEFIPHLEMLGRVAVGTQSNMGDLVGMLGTATTIFGLSGQELEDTIYYMVESARSGSISVQDFSEGLAKFMGQFKGFTGAGGFQGMTEMAGFFQAVQKSMQAAPEEVGTYGRSFLKEMALGKTQRAFAKQGIQVTDDKGKLLAIPELARVLSEARASGKLTKNLEENVFADVRAKGGFTALMQTLEADPDYFKKVTGASPEEGRKLVESQYKAMMGGEMGRIQKLQVNSQSKAIENMEEVARMERVLAEGITELQTEFPRLSKALGSLENVIMGIAGGMLMGRMIGGGSFPSASMGKTVSQAMGGADGLGKIAIASGVLSVGIATFTITKAILKILGIEDKDIEEAGGRVQRWTHGKSKGEVEVDRRVREHRRKVTDKAVSDLWDAPTIAPPVKGTAFPNTIELGENTIRKSAEATAEAVAKRSRSGGGGAMDRPLGGDDNRRSNAAGR